MGESIRFTGVQLEQMATEGFSNLVSETNFPIRIKYLLSRILGSITGEAKTYFENKNELLTKYTKIAEEDGEVTIADKELSFKKGDPLRDAVTGSILIAEGKEQEALSALNELSSTEISINFEKINVTIEDLEDWEENRGVSLSIADLTTLGAIFDIQGV